jgi:DNA polymerase-3 subunit delta'
MYALHLVRECLLLHIGEEKMVRLDGDELASFKKLAPFVHSGNSSEMAEELNKACYHIERNANARIVLFDLSLKMISLLHVKETEAAEQ